jgi:hypothetical protein
MDGGEELEFRSPNRTYLGSEALGVLGWGCGRRLGLARLPARAAVLLGAHGLRLRTLHAVVTNSG